MFAGSCAGVVEHLAMFPLDTLRARRFFTCLWFLFVFSSSLTLLLLLFLCRRSNKHMLLTARRCLCKASTRKAALEGLLFLLFFILSTSTCVSLHQPKETLLFGFRLYRGATSVLSACIPAHAAYFSIYELSKKHFVDGRPGHHPLSSAACGAAATLAHDAIMTPLDVVKQRLQLGFYNGTLDCLRKVIKYEGVSALYLSFPTTLLMNVPYGSVMMVTNDSIKTILNPSGERNVPAYFVAGGCAGGVAALVTNPLDVAKTRLQTQCMLLSPAASGLGLPTQIVTPKGKKVTRKPFTVPTHTSHSQPAGVAGSVGTMATTPQTTGHTRGTNPIPNNCKTLLCTAQPGAPVENCKVVRFTGLIETVQDIFREEGCRGFTRGLRYRMMTHIPSVATTWTTYELVKQLLAEYEPF